MNTKLYFKLRERSQQFWSTDRELEDNKLFREAADEIYSLVTDIDLFVKHIEDRVKHYQWSAQEKGSGTSQRREKWRAKVASDILGGVRSILKKE
jgi:hypothetical protein